MNRILHVIAVLIVLLCANTLWMYYVVVRFNIFDIFAILFVFFYLVKMFRQNGIKIVSLVNPLKRYIFFLWGYFFISITSGFVVIFAPVGQNQIDLFLKGIFILLFYTLFFTFFTIYISNISPQKRLRLLHWYSYGVFISVMYSFAQFILIRDFAIDLDKIVWGALSILPEHSHIDFTTDELMWGSFSGETFYRLRGLTGESNVSATYIVSILPLYFLIFLKRFKVKYFLVLLCLLAGLFFTLSMAGFVGLVVSLLVVYLLAMKKWGLYNYILIIIISIPLLIFTYSKMDELEAMYLIKTQSGISGHLTVHNNTVEMVKLRPFLGYGYNTFSAVYEKMFGIWGYNPHNSWIGFMVESGIVALIWNIIFIIFIILECLKRQSMISDAFIASLIGICVISLFHTHLDTFQVRVFILLFFSNIVFTSPNGYFYDLFKDVKKTIFRKPEPALYLQTLNPEIKRKVQQC